LPSGWRRRSMSRLLGSFTSQARPRAAMILMQVYTMSISQGCREGGGDGKRG
jgi:hypothetical protein